MAEGCFHRDGGFLLADLSIHEDEIRRRLEVPRLADRAGGPHQLRSSNACVMPRPTPLEAPGDDGDGMFAKITLK